MRAETLEAACRGRRLRVAVYGDLMLDVYRYGHVDRISPEFPIPVLREELGPPVVRPGGAANVAAQFAHLNADVTLYGLADPRMRVGGEVR